MYLSKWNNYISSATEMQLQYQHNNPQLKRIIEDVVVIYNSY